MLSPGTGVQVPVPTWWVKTLYTGSRGSFTLYGLLKPQAHVQLAYVHADKTIMQINMIYFNGANENSVLHRKDTEIGGVIQYKAQKEESLVSMDAWQMCSEGDINVVLLPSGTTQGMIQSSL